MQINHNVRAMVTQHSLFQNNNLMSKSLEKLSTGLRINRAQDDAAGLAMSEQMRSQIRGLGKAKQNAQDGQAALQIAEGGLTEISNILQRQRELAVQAANDTLTSTERNYLDQEFQELSKEIGRIALSTDYNGKSLLSSGTFYGSDKNNGTGAANKQDVNGKTWYQVEITSENSFGAVGESGANKNKAQSYTLHIGPNYSTNLGGKLSNQAPLTYHAIAFNGRIPGDLRDFKIGLFGKNSQFYEKGADNSVDFSKLSITGFDYTKSQWDDPSVKGDQKGDHVASTKQIYKAIDALDGAVRSISATRAKIGTFVNRLDYTVNNLANLEFNTQDAESRIRDTNFATEVTNFTKNQIMVQSATSMLAQANSLPQSILGLLG